MSTDRWTRLENRIGRTRNKVVPIAIRRALILRANGECEWQHKGECSGALVLHHVDGEPDNNELCNLLLLCHGHHNQADSATYDAETKRCYKCGEWKPLSDFDTDNTKYRGKASRCKDCRRNYQRKYYARSQSQGDECVHPSKRG